METRSGTERGGAHAVGRAQWYALWTRSHCEQLVHDQLAAKGFHPFLPTLRVWSVRRGKRHPVLVPLFPGYLFLNDALPKTAHVEVCRSRGLVTILGRRWDQLATVPDDEIEAMRRAIAEPTVRPHPYLRAGVRVRVVHGALRGVEGILVRVDAGRGLLVLSIHLLQRSLRVEIGCEAVKPV